MHPIKKKIITRRERLAAPPPPQVTDQIKKNGCVKDIND
jgi:hypothetical protein